MLSIIARRDTLATNRESESTLLQLRHQAPRSLGDPTLLKYRTKRQKAEDKVQPVTALPKHADAIALDISRAGFHISIPMLGQCGGLTAQQEWLQSEPDERQRRAQQASAQARAA